METNRELPTQLLRPILDTYLNAGVAITGCRSYGIARPCCEYDVLVVSNETRSGVSVKKGTTFMDLFFMSEKEVLSPSDPEIAVSLASVKPVRDNSLVFSTSSSAAKAVLRENQRKSAESRLARSLKAMGRSDEGLSKGAIQDADFWLLTASYEFAFAWVYSAEDTPAPSHLLEQLKRNSRRNSGMYEAFSRAAGLERASRKDCGERVEAVSIVYDAINALEAGEPEDIGTASTKTAFDILKAKADFLTEAIRHADCYAFLGFDVCSALTALSAIQSRSQGIEVDQSLLVATLSKGGQKMLGERILRGLGLSRDDKSIREATDTLREAVSELARKNLGPRGGL